MEKAPTAGKTKGIRSWREKYGHLPWYRRYESLAVFFVALILYAIFLLPNRGSLSLVGWMQIIVFFLAYLVWAGLILGDREKPDWLKMIVALGILAMCAWLFYRYSAAQWDRLGEVFFNWDIMNRGDPDVGVISSWRTLLDGLRLTIQLFVYSLVLATLLGLALAVLRTFNNRLLTIFIVVYIDFFRAMPLIVLMIVIYYALPFMGILLTSFTSGVLVLSINSAAYKSEIFRAGIESIHHGQLEAARSLGMNAWQAMRLVILPQALRVIIPPYTSNAVGLLKATALCSTIAIFELLKSAQQIQAWFANPTPLIVAAMMYLIILLPLTRLSSVLERRRQVIR